MWMLKLLLLYSQSFGEAGNVLGQRYEKGPKVRKIRDVLDKSTTILNFWSSSTPGYPRKPFYRQVRQSCGGCWYTNDRSIEKSASAILFDNTRFSIGNKHNDVKFWDPAFNLTLSYRLDSDIHRPFGNTITSAKFLRFDHGRRLKPLDRMFSDLLALKTAKKHTAWLVSNCDRTNGASKRMEYADQMMNSGLSLDGFGECFNNTLTGSPWTHGSDIGPIAKYKFYLAFENSVHCNDYISEKFWRNALANGAVPIVFGPHRDDVAKIAPVKSYIHTEDFDSPAHLVDYLDYLDGNDTAYMEYHAWRADVSPAKLQEKNSIDHLGNYDQMMCNLCKTINERKSAGFPKKTIPSVAHWWWMEVHDEKCTADFEVPVWLRTMDTDTNHKSVRRHLL
ncbi:unnamed protein product [Oikopleura dioica]|uniref:Fucosyltransferase n=1 Tax=Oikopleura dioica TaxID=34765 RepID=E4YZ85_OIKDI|nr:unnamed protein product [Oikopleura dioica]